MCLFLKSFVQISQIGKYFLAENFNLKFRIYSNCSANLKFFF